ncbi:MAG: peptide chain release factor N(5)-glutamine methyltransferase [Lentisphaeria bacterium]|nr:peptide chain release factor N(5)-glutamine methyltransferase [Lentisphaeria bacterium]
MKIGEYQKKITACFQDHGFECPETEAEYILAEVTRYPERTLLMHAGEELDQNAMALAENFLKRRLANEPFQYIFGWTPFRDLDLKVGPGVLIPRPETEWFVDFILKKLPRNASVCELGTGSGAVSLSLAAERKDLTVYGSELSPEAFAWSELNRKESGLKNVHFFQGSLFQPFQNMTFDAVFANLPYIDPEEREILPPNVRDYEPDKALFADDKGFALMEQTLREAPLYLNQQRAFLFFEMGETQGSRLADSALQGNFFEHVTILPDQYGVRRFLFAEHLTL